MNTMIEEMIGENKVQVDLMNPDISIGVEIREKNSTIFLETVKASHNRHIGRQHLERIITCLFHQLHTKDGATLSQTEIYSRIKFIHGLPPPLLVHTVTAITCRDATAANSP